MGVMDRISSGHLRRIDNLRGIAIAAVILFHFYGASFGVDHPKYTGFWIEIQGRSHSWWLLYPLGFGWTGVALFFVISGYVIHRSYLLDRCFTWSAYASRRFWRIFPTYFVVVSGFTLWQGVPFASKDFVLHVLLLHNLTNATFFSINPSFWSLAVECQLYALYPLALVVWRRFGVSGMLGFGCVASAFWTVGAYIWADLPWPQWAAWASPIALWPGWLLGAAVAEYHQAGKRLFKHPVPWALGSGALLIIASCSRLTLPLGSSLASVASAALVDAYLTSEKLWDRSSIIKPLGLFGICSYSVYLVHQPLLGQFIYALSAMGVGHHPALQIAIGCPLFFFLIFGLGWVLYALIEKGGQQIGKSVRASTQRHASESLPRAKSLASPTT
jgi:peptidoglycan/LPS O-acetylase OafA/YrhL